MKVIDETGQGWTVVLRRMPARSVAGEAAGGYTNAFEIVCCECGDDPDLDYREVSPELQRIRGPYQPITAGIAAYEDHIARHGRAESQQRDKPPGTVSWIHARPGSPTARSQRSEGGGDSPASG